MKLKIIKRHAALGNDKNPRPDVVCKDDKGNEHIVDIWVEGGLGDEITFEDVVGKTIECDYMHTYLSIANKVRFEQPKRDKE